MTRQPSRLDPLRRATATWARLLAILIVGGIVAGYLDHRRAIPGMLAGTLVAFMVSGGALVLLFLQRRSRQAALAEFPLQSVASTIAVQFFVIAVMLLYGHVLWAWWPSDALNKTTWFSPLFFGIRLVAYYLVLVLTVVSFKQKGGIAERFLIAPVVLVGASYDLVIGMHPPAPFWLGTLVWLPLISFGVAGAAAVALAVVALLKRTGAVAGDPAEATRWLGRRMLLASIVALVSAGIAVALIGAMDVAAAWRPHGAGMWRTWLIIAAVLVALACAMLVAPNPTRLVVGAIFVMLAFAIVAFVAILPATLHSSTGIGVYALGGFAAGIAAPAFGLIAAINRLPTRAA